MPITTKFNFKVLAFFCLLIGGFFAAGILVPDTLENGEPSPLGTFMFIMGGIFLAVIGGITVFALVRNRKLKRIMSTWIDATAEITEAAETGTYINRQPVIRFVLKVSSPVRGEHMVEHKRVMPLTALQHFSKGRTVNVKQNPEKPEEIVLV